MSEAGTHPDVLAGLIGGTTIATWCYEEGPPNHRLGDIGLEIAVDGGDVVITGAKRPIESATVADLFLVTGRTGSGLTQVLVPAGTPGVSTMPLQTVDLTRRFASVSFDNVRLPAAAVVGEVGAADASVDRQLNVALVLTCAEAVGAMQRAFDLTVEWAFDRYAFGRPLASYQALKHRFADMKSWLEASHAIADDAAAAVSARSEDAGELASIAKAFIGTYGSELIQDCVQLHGGIGLTFEHDIHLFLRRHTVNRTLFGIPSEHRHRLANALEHREPAT